MSTTQLLNLGGKVTTLFTAGDEAVAHVGDELIRFAAGGIGERWFAPGVTAISSATSEGKASNSCVVFGTDDDEGTVLKVWDGGVVQQIGLNSEALSICHCPRGYIFVAEKGRISVFHYNSTNNSLRRVNLIKVSFNTTKMWLTTINGHYSLYVRDKSGACYIMHRSEGSEAELSLNNPTVTRAFDQLFCCDGETYLSSFQKGKIRVFQADWQADEKYPVSSPLRKITYTKTGLVLLFDDKFPAVLRGRKGLGTQEEWTFIRDFPYGDVAALNNMLVLSRGHSVKFQPLPE